MMELNKIYTGKMESVLKDFPDNCIDSIVTDPPYGLKFMGKHWDYNVPTVDQWKEAIRVLKPGGFLLSFGGTRTYHRMVVNIEDAGFEIRDQIQWLYGSGFPKSLDISKAIDKQGVNPLAWKIFATEYKEAITKSIYTHADIDKYLGIKSSSCYWARLDNRGGMPPKHHWGKVMKLLNLPAEFEGFYLEAERVIIGSQSITGEHGTAGGFKNGIASLRDCNTASKREIDLTEPATPAAKEWEGWGTALKPANEPICVARKPVEGTVAQNVLKYGTGGLNIDGCRVEFKTDEDKNSAIWGRGTDIIGGNYVGGTHPSGKENIEANHKGRFPANVILDEFMGAELDKQTGNLVSGGANGNRRGHGPTHGDVCYGEYRGLNTTNGREPDEGGASRFFYCPKPDNFERNKGLKDFDNKEIKMYGDFKGTPEHAAKENIMKRNTHPTVKPIDLMRYLVKLVTPKGGICLDPFCGSGTTLIGCKMELINFIGIDMDHENAILAEARVGAWNPDLFKPQKLF